MKQYGLRILLLIGMLPALLVGLGAGRVLCIGGNGHFAVEPACSSQVACAPAEAGGCEDEEQPVLVEFPGCGPCVDIPGATSLMAQKGRGEGGMQALTWLVLSAPMPMVFTAGGAEPLAIRPADTPSGGQFSHFSTTVLLI